MYLKSTVKLFMNVWYIKDNVTARIMQNRSVGYHIPLMGTCRALQFRLQ